MCVVLRCVVECGLSVVWVDGCVCYICVALSAGCVECVCLCVCVCVYRGHLHKLVLFLHKLIQKAVFEKNDSVSSTPHSIIFLLFIFYHHFSNLIVSFSFNISICFSLYYLYPFFFCILPCLYIFFLSLFYLLCINFLINVLL